MERKLGRHKFSIVDIVVVFFLIACVYGVSLLAQRWQGDYKPTVEIDLSYEALPLYVFFSLVRNFQSYFLSMAFALVMGYWAAKSKIAERIIIPFMDILQCVPVLGFLPGIVLGLISLFPNSNLGLELASVIMIFTSQAWNLVFSWYTSLKSVPHELEDASKMMGLSRFQIIRRLELPYAASSLAWNSLLSIAGGWFFLTICEAFTLGDKQFRLPGIGSYMAEAIRQDNKGAMVAGIGAMVVMIVLLDILLWRPLLVWVMRYRSDENEASDVGSSEPLMSMIIRDSKILDWITALARQIRDYWQDSIRSIEHSSIVTKPVEVIRLRQERVSLQFPWISRVFWFVVVVFCSWGIFYMVAKLIGLLSVVSVATWGQLLLDCLITLLRVLGSTILSSLWTIPLGIWIGISARRVRRAQPLIQILASFPAPMLFPLLLGVLFWTRMSFDVSAMVLMMAGVQWYVLFNVVAGAIRIPTELNSVADMMQLSLWQKWKTLYFPSIFPNLITGWVTAAGGAWNCSIVAEYVTYDGKIITARGLGSTLSRAAENVDFPLLAASLTVMIVTIVIFNRLVWVPLFRLAETRFRLDE